MAASSGSHAALRPRTAVAEQQQWVIQGPMLSSPVTCRIYQGSFQSRATPRIIAEPGRAASFGGNACAGRELKMELGYMFDHFEGASK